MRVFYVNFDVGSAIEFVGNVFLDWIKECGCYSALTEYKSQVQESHMISALADFRPDIIILNESFSRSAIASLHYKKCFPNTKIVLLEHSWQKLDTILLSDTNRALSPEDENVRYVMREFYREIDLVYLLNYRPYYKWPSEPIRIRNFYHPMSPMQYHLSNKWADRTNLFCYVGAIAPHKFSIEFLEKIQSTNLQIDCYGRRITSNDEYNKKFDECKNISYKGLLPQGDVGSVLNKYKFYVMPHDGSEPFNVSLLQSILCGTIPLVVNDRTGSFDYTWIDWAKGLYFGCNKVDELIQNMQQIVGDVPDSTEVSEYIADSAFTKFNYDKFKKAFVDDLWAFYTTYPYMCEDIGV